MKQFFLTFILLTLSGASFASDRVVVVANIAQNSVTLTKSQVRDLFMSGASPESLPLSPVTISPGEQSRTIFNTRIIGLPESRIQAYWAQMRFSGRLTPPKEVESEEQMLDYLKANEGSIGYLSESTRLPDGLKVVYITR
jgi:ABC-type phosphate transport system substrate-binding protein